MRRAICVAAAFLVVLLTAWANAAVGDAAPSADDRAPTVVAGKVFLDANGNGKFDPGEKGISGVRVTDGIQFVTTADDGAYRLTIAPDYMIPYRAAQTVSLSWPTGKWPTGKWWVRLSDVSDAQQVDFGLRDDTQQLPFAFVHMSDDHGSGKMYSEHYGPDVRRMGDTVKFCLNTGDMGYATLDGAEEMFRSIADHAARFPVPVFITPGNHDFVGEDKNKNALMDSHPLIGHGAMTKYCGPVRWSFDYAGVHFISLDYMERSEKGYDDRIPRVAVDWADKDLAAVDKATRVVLLAHCYNAAADFYRLLKKYKPAYVCCGHTHTPSYARLAGVPCHTNYGLCTMVVTDGAIDVAEGLPASLKTSAIFGYFRGVVRPAMEKRRQKQHSLTERPLGGDPQRLDGDPAAESAEIVVEIELGAARRVVVRFGQQKTVDIVFDGKSVDIAGVPFPIGLPPGQDTLKWHVLMDRDRLTIFGNDIFRTTKAVKVDSPARVTLAAEGAGAILRKADLWELRPVRNQNSRSLYHFAPPGWYWGQGQLQGACLEQTDEQSQGMLKRYSPDGIMDYDID